LTYSRVFEVIVCAKPNDIYLQRHIDTENSSSIFSAIRSSDIY
jgi:hypothetical protein